MGRLQDKVALITGGAGGLGQAIAGLFVHEGACVVVTDINGQSAEAAARELDETGVRAIGLAHDVTSEDDWQRVLDRVDESFGDLHVLVNNAGIGDEGTIEDTDLAGFRRHFAINVDGTFLGCQRALHLLKSSGGASIINMSSVSGIVASPNLIAYSAAKAAVRHLSKCVAMHCTRMGYDVRCNSVHPAFVRTSILDPMVDKYGAAVLDKLAGQIPMKRLGTPREVADACLYLASGESSFMTGAELVLDGGLSAR